MKTIIIVIKNVLCCDWNENTLNYVVVTIHVLTYLTCIFFMSCSIFRCTDLPIIFSFVHTVPTYTMQGPNSVVNCQWINGNGIKMKFIVFTERVPSRIQFPMLRRIPIVSNSIPFLFNNRQFSIASLRPLALARFK